MKRVKKRIPDKNEGDREWNPYAAYDASDGCFGVIVGKNDSRCIDWVHCREELQSAYPHVSRILYFTNHIKEVAAFIEDAEKILKLSPRHRAKLYHTNQKDVLYCQLSNWWTSKVRRQLFTILLRAGKEYDLNTRNFWACARKNNYLSRTNTAFRYFMSGHTTYRSSPIPDDFGYFGCFDGWVDCFSYITSHEIKKMLKKPKKGGK